MIAEKISDNPVGRTRLRSVGRSFYSELKQNRLAQSGRQAVPTGFCEWSVKKFFRTATFSGEMFTNLTPVW